MTIAYDTVGLSFAEDVCRISTHNGGVETILTGRGSATLHVA